MVVAAADVSAKVEAALERAEGVLQKELQASEAAIEDDVKEAESEANG